jgi:hypothetical protein
VIETLVENLLEKDFRDVFKPASEEEVQRRVDVEVQRLIDEVVHARDEVKAQAGRLLGSFEEMVRSRKVERANAKKLFRNAPRLLRWWTTKEDPGFRYVYAGRYPTSDQRLLKWLLKFSDLDVSDERLREVAVSLVTQRGGYL